MTKPSDYNFGEIAESTGLVIGRGEEVCKRDMLIVSEAAHTAGFTTAIIGYKDSDISELYLTGGTNQTTRNKVVEGMKTRILSAQDISESSAKIMAEATMKSWEGMERLFVSYTTAVSENEIAIVSLNPSQNAAYGWSESAKPIESISILCPSKATALAMSTISGF